MALALRVAMAFAWRAALAALVLVGGLAVLNSSGKWDGRAHYFAQDRQIVGQPGVLVVVLAQPGLYDATFYVNFMEKLFGPGGVVPFPISALAGADNGVVLVDPENPTARAPTPPRTLADVNGSTVDLDGVPWVEKWRRGELRWLKPSAIAPHDPGAWLYPGRRGGLRVATQRVLAKARYIYYARLPGGYLPHYDLTIAMADGALARVRAAHPDAPAAIVDAFHPARLRAAVDSVLDAGADTIVLASALPIYSDFEELRGSYALVHKAVEEWRARHGGKPVRIVIPEPLGLQPAYRAAYGAVLAEALPPAASPDAAVRVLLSNHGLPPDLMKRDIWRTFAAPVNEGLAAEFRKVAAARGYATVEIINAMEAFADGGEDPRNELLSIGEAFRQAAADKAPLAIAVPVEFLAENTDTLYAHSVAMLDGLPGYTPWEGPPADVDWSRPYQRRFQVGPTTLIYAGSPGGDGQSLLMDALAGTILDALAGPPAARAALEPPHG